MRGTIKQVADETKVWTKAEYEAYLMGQIKLGQYAKTIPALEEMAKTEEELAEASNKLKAEYADLSTILGGDLTRKTQEYNGSLYDLRVEAGVLTSTIDRLEGKKYLTAKQKEELIEAKKKLGENQGAVKKLAEEHDKATKEIILGFVQQAAAADGVITQQEFDKIAALGKSWGVYDEKTATAISNSKRYLEDAGMSVNEFDRKIDAMSTSVWDAYAVTKNVAAEWAKLKSKSITLTVKTNWKTSPGPGGVPYPTPGGQHGLDMTVPPGFPNDSFPILATSGERVSITPAGKKGAGADIIIQEQNIYIEGGDSEATADAVLSRFAEASRAAANAGISYAG